jgi:hypothetical protein
VELGDFDPEAFEGSNKLLPEPLLISGQSVQLESARLMLEAQVLSERALFKRNQADKSLRTTALMMPAVGGIF